MKRGVLYGENNGNYKTGFCCKGKDRNLYNSWTNMKQRCLNPKSPKYYRYGGRNIKICEEWLNFANFAEWALSNGWKKGLSIDRIDNNKNYEPSNCRWVTIRENSQKSSRIKLNYKKAENIRKRCSEDRKVLAEEFNVSVKTIDAVLNYREWN